VRVDIALPLELTPARFVPEGRVAEATLPGSLGLRGRKEGITKEEGIVSCMSPKQI
jgi:hypothetical protein